MSIDVSKGRAGAFDNALLASSVGDEIVYWVGLFCGGPHRENAWRAYEAEFVVLYTRREKRGFQYIAKRIK